MPLDDELLSEQLRRYRLANWRQIQKLDADGVDAIVASQARPSMANTFELLGGVDALRSCRVLDVGCGVGSFLAACEAEGIDAVGVEPDRIGVGSEITAVAIAHQRLERPVVASAAGEHLPFPADAFDRVVLLQVLEHVGDIGSVLRERLRVVRADGVIYLESPNYLTWWEPHYRLRWVPLLPKRLGQAYLRRRGRDAQLFDELTYTTHRRIETLVEAAGGTWVDLQWESITGRLTSAQPSRSPLGRVLRGLWRTPPGRAVVTVLFRLWQRLTYRQMAYLVRPR